MIRVCVAGITGWTGSAVAEGIRAADDLELVAGVARTDPGSYPSVAEALAAAEADVVVDYTHADAVKKNVVAALERGVGVVVGTSGLTGDDYSELDAARPREGRRRHRCGQLLADCCAPAPLRGGGRRGTSRRGR